MIQILLMILAGGILRAEPREFEIRREMIPMRDGVQVAATLLLPHQKFAGEKFPVLLEMQPYRKDDLFLARDYSLHSYFARAGFVVIKADVRGTGSSTGKIPDREYSQAELRDAEELIQHYASRSWSNGRVGMWGISWSGFNALMTALRKPPALKAVLAAHASDDLFHDDVHFIDGNFHVDQYELSIENDLSLPRSPDYKFDQEYFRDRFNREPWFLRYKRETRNGKFWEKESLRGQYHRLTTPTFLIGGLLDGYRDTPLRLLDFANAPVRALIGDWGHEWPTVEWREEAVKFWNYWLRDQGERPVDGELLVFQRQLEKWLSIHWRGREKLFEEIPLSGVVPHRPTTGVASGYWWGDKTPDMAEDGKSKLVVDSPVLAKPVSILGQPRVHLAARTTGKWAHWAVQLEDVFPDGRVELVTGAVLNSSQNPSLEFDLHFTTWTFKPGHRIRVTLSHSLFPMIWPMPFHVSSQLLPGSVIRLPLLPGSRDVTWKMLEPAQEFEKYPGLISEQSRWPYERRTFRDQQGRLNVGLKADKRFVQDGKEFFIFEETTHRTHDEKPWESSFTGRASHSVKLKSRQIRVTTKIDVWSTRRHFHIRFTRTAEENGRIIRRKTWVDKIRRGHH